jgi:hypothetical protein
VLQHLYDKTAGPLWSDNTGWRVFAPVGDPCNSNFHFSGVGCHCHCRDEIEGPNCRQCRITRIDLPRRQLQGTIPPSLSIMGKLSTLDFGDNTMSGTLPTQLGLLSKLSRLHVQNNRISGTLPTQLGSIGGAAHRGFTTAGILMGGTGDWTSEVDPLTSFRMENNRISGAIPSELGNLMDLTAFDISGNVEVCRTPTPNAARACRLSMTSVRVARACSIAARRTARQLVDCWQPLRVLVAPCSRPLQRDALRDRTRRGTRRRD